MAIRIITDSTSDIGKQEAAQKGIGVAGLTVVIDGVEYTEGENITYENFYSLSENSNQVLTSQPSPSVFAKLFNEAKRAGDKVIGLFVSSHLSGTYQSACIAAESCGMQDIYLIDTQNISISVRLMVYTALELIKKGISFDKLCEKMEEYKERLDAYAIIGDLKYLKRSGRLSPTTAFVANLFNMKPITTLKGKVEVISKARGSRAAIEKTLDIIQNTTTGIDRQEMCIVGHTGMESVWYKDLVIRLEERFSIGKNLSIHPIGASVGNHVGAGTVALAFFRNK